MTTGDSKIASVQSIDFRLRVFLAVAEAGSITRAGQVLNLSQPAVTRHIRLLEDALSLKLMRRHGRGVELTAMGETLRRQVEEPFGQIDNALERITGTGEHPFRHLQLASVHTLNLYLTAQLLAALHRKHQRLGIRVYCRSSEEVVELVERGQCDVGLVYETKVNSDLFEHRFLHRENFVLFHHPTMNLPRDQKGHVIVDRTVPLVVPPSTFAVRQAINRMLGNAVDEAIEVETVDLMLQIVQLGSTACLLPDNVPSSMVESAGLARSQISGPRLSRSVVAIFLRRRSQDPLITAVMSELSMLKPRPQKT